MYSESPERIKTGERLIEIKDQNGDIGQETREYFADGSYIGRGEITQGPNAGKKWVRGQGSGIIDGEFDLRALGISEAVAERSTNNWGYMEQGGQEPGQPKTGDNWFKPLLHMAKEIPAEHEDAELIAKEGVEKETDHQGRIIYQQEHKGADHTVLRRTYHDDLGYLVETTKYIDGPQQGRVSEVRRPIDETAPVPVSANLQTPAGTLGNLHVRRLAIDRELSDAEKSFMLEPQQEMSRERMRGAATLDIGGEWSNT